jgi:PAS domain S-box-containing protein
MNTDANAGIQQQDDRLREENRQLRCRLAELEDTLRAIRTGEVDALVIETPGGPQVYSLEGADQPYRVLVEAMSEGAASVNEQGVVLYANRRLADMLGVPLERLMGSPMTRWISADHEPAFDALWDLARSGQSRGEVALCPPGGGTVPAYLSLNAVQQGPRHVFCLVATDLSEQKRNEELFASGALARSVLEQATDAIVVCDARGRVIRANASARRLCADNPLLRPFDAVFVIETADCTEPGSGTGARNETDHDPGIARAAVEGRLTGTVPALLRQPDGSRVELLLSATTLEDAADRVIGCIIGLTDVSESRRAEAAIRDSEARFRSVLENALDAAYRRDLNTETFDYLGPAMEAMSGFSVEQFSGMTDQQILSLVHPDDRPATHDALKAAETSGVLKAEYRLRCASGEYRWFADWGVILRDEQSRLHFRAGVLRDVTDRKRTEEALRVANAKLAEIDRRKSEFLALLSHELRNPLAPIKNGVHILQRAAPGSDQARRALGVIDRQVSQMTRLVDDLLELTRISRNKVRLKRERVELNRLVRRTLDDQRALFEKADVSLEIDLAPEPMFVDVDANRIAQVLGNLLHNAAKYTPSGGRVTVVLRPDSEQALATLRVSDTGIGIAPEMLPHLFEAFAQADKTLDRSQGGLGLGLTLVARLVELHGGDVAAHSEGLDKGAEFVVRLPLAREAGAVAPGSAGQRTASRRLRVLVIEDNLDAAQTLCDLLQSVGHEVEEAHDGPQGVAKARTFLPEAVLCDIGLPGMNGYEVARSLRADAALQGALLIAVSGYALPDDRQRATEAGFDRHLVKPASLDKIEHALASAALAQSTKTRR